MSNDLWRTPPEIFEALNAEFIFGIDVCASHENAKCVSYFTEEQDALSLNWADEALGFREGKVKAMMDNNEIGFVITGYRNTAVGERPIRFITGFQIIEYLEFLQSSSGSMLKGKAA